MSHSLSSLFDKSVVRPDDLHVHHGAGGDGLLPTSEGTTFNIMPAKAGIGGWVHSLRVLGLGTNATLTLKVANLPTADTARYTFKFRVSAYRATGTGVARAELDVHDKKPLYNPGIVIPDGWGMKAWASTSTTSIHVATIRSPLRELQAWGIAQGDRFQTSDHTSVAATREEIVGGKVGYHPVIETMWLRAWNSDLTSPVGTPAITLEAGPIGGGAGTYYTIFKAQRAVGNLEDAPNFYSNKLKIVLPQSLSIFLTADTDYHGTNHCLLTGVFEKNPNVLDPTGVATVTS